MRLAAVMVRNPLRVVEHRLPDLPAQAHPVEEVALREAVEAATAYPIGIAPLRSGTPCFPPGRRRPWPVTDDGHGDRGHTV